MSGKVPYAGKERRSPAAPPASSRVQAHLKRAERGQGRQPRIAVTFDRQTFDRIAGVAKSRRLTFATVVREAVERVMSETESDQGRG